MAATPSLESPLSFIPTPWLMGIGIVVASVFLGLMILVALRKTLVRRGRFSVAFDMKILLVRVPKELKKEDSDQDKTQQSIQESIGRMETVFSTLGSLARDKGFVSWLFGRSDVYTVEMVVHHDRISFYVGVPSKQQSFIEQQIHAQYPNAQIDEVSDYNMFSPDGLILASYVGLRRPSYFSIKTYRKLESDSMNSLTNALAKIDTEDGASIQYVIRSAPASWRKEGMRIARAMQQGKKLEDVKDGSWLKAFGKFVVDLHKAGDEKRKPDEAYRLSPLEEEMVKGLEEKSSKAGLEVNIRVLVSSKTPEKAQRYLNDILSAYGQFNIYEFGNSFIKRMPRFQNTIIRHFIFRHFDERYHIVLNAEELASLFHFPLATTETPKINWLLSRKTIPPSNLPTEGILLGRADYRNHRYDIRMKPTDRRQHQYIIGKSGSGKTAFLASLIRQDIINGNGVCVIDPHGDLCDEALSYVPKSRANDVIFFDPGDFERPIGINMLEFDPRYPHLRTFVINEMLKIFELIFKYVIVIAHIG